MIYIISFCEFPMNILPWLLSGLLGLLAGYLLWARWKAKFEEMESSYNSLMKKYNGLEADLKDCSHKRAILEGDISTANGRVKEMQYKMDEWEKAKASAAKASTTQAASPSGDASKATAAASSLVTNLVDKTESKEASGINSAYAGLKNTNLQIIEGIGPKMNEVLQDAGVKTWSDLAAKSEADVRAILDSHGDKYKIINPDSWPQQASLAAAGKWDELIDLQKKLDTGADTNIDLTDSKLEKIIAKASSNQFGKFKANDLKIVEGIGPKIAELLNNAGINTWAELSNTSTDKIQEILDAAGSRFGLANPSTWPQQAELAAAGKWQELSDLQDSLNGGV